MGKVRFFVLAILILLLCLKGGFTQAESANHGVIRQPVVAGKFYPSNARILRSIIDDFLRMADPPEIKGELIALMVPHAGYSYSGSTAAWGYKLLEGKSFETVVILGPSHSFYYRGCSVYNIGDYKTPLGIVKVNRELCNKIIEEDGQTTYYGPLHQSEHSIEVELPFLQIVLGDFSLIPIVIGERRMATCKGLADALVKVLKTKKVLLIASSDMSHYYEYNIANFIDEKTLRIMQEFSPSKLLDKLDSGDAQLCGGAAVVTAMMVAKKLGADKVKILKYANSGDTAGGKKNVVGYAAVAFYK
jgi:AmmeMemoRadiSam system protein B